MARKKIKAVESEKVSLADQVKWLTIHKDQNLFVEEPARTGNLDIFTMLDDVPLVFRAGEDRLVSCAGAYKLFLRDTNEPLFNNLAANAAAIL